MADISVGGYVPMTSIDFPGHLSAVVFTRGCPLACSYCHNDHLRSPKVKISNYSWTGVYKHLLKRIDLLDAVVFSGGEPTAQKHLKDAILECKELGYKIGLHSSGIYPNRLAEIIDLIDWVGFDIKAPFEDYESITSVKYSGQKAMQSLKLLLDNSVNIECRTTFHPSILSNEQLFVIAKSLAGLGVNNYKIQNFRSTGCMDKKLCLEHPFKPIDNKIINEIAAFFKEFHYDAC
ncbi:MAG: anaerobic ribonucleoside-triphosphate reductase activating protein [Rickettsiaceae bacterium]|nr:anaerobic ribonucleoside-triphosphate reductase activating protein [Rickettsiaceae bacterium]